MVLIDMRSSSKIWQYAVYVFLVIAIGLQIWSTISTQNIVNDAKQQALKLGKDKDNVEVEKNRQELISKQIENSTKGVIGATLATGFSALAVALATIGGAILAWRTYTDTRAKERQDRLGTELNNSITRLVASEDRQRVVGAAGLLPFFVVDRADFHLQALTAVIAAARFDNELPQVQQGIRLAVERALAVINHETVMQVSWQNVTLPSTNFAGRNLSHIDLRDAYLENSTFAGACLDNADLNNAKLQGAHFDGASLKDANLFHADLAGATLEDADLRGANLEGIKVLNLELRKANFTEIGAGWRSVPWDAARNWREAVFDPDVRTELEARYGREAPLLRVTMLLWEIPPMVAGGTWTACYHLVRKLRQRGAEVTVVVPWDEATILPLPFGIEIPIVALGIAAFAEIKSVYSTPVWSPYPSAPSDSNLPNWSAYRGSTPLWSGYSGTLATGSEGAVSFGIYGSYNTLRTAAESATSLAGSSLFRLIGEFRRRLRSYIRDHPTDLIHAHDWVTFDAAGAAAHVGNVPWIAHFHSTEADRQTDNPDPLIERIEREAIQTATRIIVPSKLTKAKLISNYDASEAKVDSVPNPLSEDVAPTFDMGRFESKRVIFLGRLSRQKGVDRFCSVARVVREKWPDFVFDVFGDGEQRGLLAANTVNYRGPVGWNERGQAFRGASAIVVPSRSEPFGMVVLEAMQHRVPVIYPNDSGAAEVLESGIKVRSDDITAISDRLVRLLNNLETWEATVRAEAREVEEYSNRGYVDQVISIWKQAAPQRSTKA